MDEDKDRTLYCGNLSEKATEEILYELFLQAGPVEKVHLPKDKDGKQRFFSFITYKHECSVPYALQLFEKTRLFGRTLTLKPRNGSVHESVEIYPVGAKQHSRTQSCPTQAPIQHPANSTKPPLFSQVPISALYTPAQPYFVFNGNGIGAMGSGIMGAQATPHPHYAWNRVQQPNYQRNHRDYHQHHYQNGRGVERRREDDDHRHAEDRRNRNERHGRRSSRY